MDAKVIKTETPAKALSIFSPPWMGNFLSEPAGRVRYRIETRLEFALQPPPCGAFSPALQAFLSFFLGVGHNKPRGAVQVVGDGLHDVLRMRFGQPHVPRRAPMEPSAHGAKRALNPAPRPANPRVELLRARREPLSAGRPAHDAVLAPHAPDRRPILRRGVALVCVDGDAPGQAGPAQGPLEVPGAARVGRGGLLGEDHAVGVSHRVPLVAEAELPGLPDPARLPVHVRPGHLPEHGRRPPPPAGRPLPRTPCGRGGGAGCR